jgi:hypothetical protein
VRAVGQRRELVGGGVLQIEARRERVGRRTPGRSLARSISQPIAASSVTSSASICGLALARSITKLTAPTSSSP